VSPSHQGRGLGSRCLAFMKGEAGRPIELRVLKHDPRARAFYERHGFRVIGETDDHHELRWDPS